MVENPNYSLIFLIYFVGAGLETPDQLSARSIVAVLATEVSGELRSSDLFLDFAFNLQL